jgi:hypothetical protein
MVPPMREPVKPVPDLPDSVVGVGPSFRESQTISEGSFPLILRGI